jgi:hypothetical protein
MEDWRDVPGFDGRYRVSDRGAVYRHSFLTRRRKIGAGLVAPFPDTRGYLLVNLQHPEKGRVVEKVHRLVLLAFRGDPPFGSPHGLHRNDTRNDNRLDNLYWGSSNANGKDRVRNGLTRRGRPRPELRVLTDGQAEEIRLRWLAGDSQRTLANAFDVCEATVCDIVKGRTYRPQPQ